MKLVMNTTNQYGDKKPVIESDYERHEFIELLDSLKQNGWISCCLFRLNGEIDIDLKRDYSAMNEDPKFATVKGSLTFKP